MNIGTHSLQRAPCADHARAATKAHGRASFRLLSRFGGRPKPAIRNTIRCRKRKFLFYDRIKNENGTPQASRQLLFCVTAKKRKCLCRSNILFCVLLIELFRDRTQSQNSRLKAFPFLPIEWNEHKAKHSMSFRTPP